MWRLSLMQKGHFVKARGYRWKQIQQIFQKMFVRQPSGWIWWRSCTWWAESEVGGVQSGDYLDQNVLQESKRSSNTIIISINRKALRKQVTNKERSRAEYGEKSNRTGGTGSRKRGEHCYGQLRGALKREGATTSHPLSDLWVAAMTDGEPLKLKVKSENPAIFDCHCHRGKDK